MSNFKIESPENWENIAKFAAENMNFSLPYVLNLIYINHVFCEQKEMFKMVIISDNNTEGKIKGLIFYEIYLGDIQMVREYNSSPNIQAINKLEEIGEVSEQLKNFAKKYAESIVI